ncbi:MAG: hypothetical protein FWC80_00535 [Firmicutes bacterium]|nr:hypothetical protein [Bacillota bacterium]
MENDKIIDTPESATGFRKRWLVTINNPIFIDSDLTELDPTNTDLEVLETHYDLSVLQETENQEYFEYRYFKVEKDGKDKIIKRPFFKDLDCVEKYLKTLKDFGNLKYAIYQYERGENGTPHIQGFIIYKNNKRFKNVKQDFPTGHLIIPNGSNIENRDYCTKKDTRIAPPVEIGEFSEMRSRNDIVQFFEMLKLGASNVLLKNMFPVLYAQYGPDKIERFRQDELKEEHGQRFRDIKVTYIYGNTRLGKTTYIYDKYDIKDICRVNNYERGTFEDYQNQKILVLDEFTGKIEITFMNNLLDKFPVNLPARFANRMACFDEVYIISNLPLDKLYTFERQTTPEVYNAFIQRIHNIIQFTALGVWHYELQDGKAVYKAQSKQTELIPVADDELPF